MKKTAKKTAKRWVTSAEQQKLTKLQQAHCSYITKLIESNKLDPKAKKVLITVRKHVIDSVNVSGRLTYERYM